LCLLTIIGGGLTGLEAADSLFQQGLSIRIIEANPHILGKQINTEGAILLQEILNNHTIDIQTNTHVTSINRNENHIVNIACSTNTHFTTELIIIAVGTRTNNKLLKTLAIDMHAENILVNEHMRTSNPYIWAAGDVCAIPDQQTGIIQRSVLWPDAMMQGAHAAYSMTGNPKSYPGLMAISSSSFFGQRFASYGPVSNIPEGWSTIRAHTNNGYHLFLLDKNESLSGFALVGAAKSVGTLRRMISSRTPTDEATLMRIAHGSLD
jgi:nitrite reductase (NADH) large subunit